MSDNKDLVLACEDLRKIEKDVAFELVEAYQSRHMEDFADALLTLQSLVEIVSSLCAEPR